MSGITDEIIEHPPRNKREGGFSFLQVGVMVMLVLGAAVYIGETLFGQNSLEVLLSLKQQQSTLEHKIQYISRENAALQKKYLELKVMLSQTDSPDKEQP